MWIIVYTIPTYVTNIPAKKEKEKKDPRFFGQICH